MSPDPVLFTPPTRPTGPRARALATTLRAWRARNHLTGDEHAAKRSILRELARLADEAEAAQRRGDRSEFSAANVVGAYRAALDAYAPPATQPIDPRAGALEAAALAIIDDTADDQ